MKIGPQSQIDGQDRSIYWSVGDQVIGLGFTGNGAKISEIQIGFQYASDSSNISFDGAWDTSTTWRLSMFNSASDFDGNRVHHPGYGIFQVTPPDYLVDFSTPSNPDFLTPVRSDSWLIDGVTYEYNTYIAKFDVSRLDWHTIDGAHSTVTVTPKNDLGFFFQARSGFVNEEAAFNDQLESGWQGTHHPNPGDERFKVTEYNGRQVYAWDELVTTQFAAAKITTVPEPGSVCVLIVVAITGMCRRNRICRPTGWQIVVCKTSAAEVKPGRSAPNEIVQGQLPVSSEPVSG